MDRRTGRLQSFAYSFEGLAFLLRNEPNMRIHALISTLVIAAGLWFKIDIAEWRWIALAIGLVVSAEAFNTAIEQACNAVSDDFRPAIKAAKDVAAGAVLVAAATAAFIGSSVFYPHLFG